MKSEDIYKGIGGIGPDLIEEAENAVFPRRRVPNVLKWAAAAAIFVVFCGVGVYAAAGGFTVKKLSINGYEVSADISRKKSPCRTGRPCSRRSTTGTSLRSNTSAIPQLK